MNQKATLYGIIGLLAGILIAILFSSSVVNSGNTGMMRMMGMNTERVRDMMEEHEDEKKGEEMMRNEMTMGQMSEALKGKAGDEFDKAFIELMIDHHEGAIEMAKQAQENAKHDEIKKLAEDIITAQTSEIEMMRNWEKSWGY